jgi:hypothetical protein
VAVTIVEVIGTKRIFAHGICIGCIGHNHRASRRDARVDFFRGLALMFIFIDHVKENALQYVTMQNFGFADAAEVFVALAGYASFLAYTRVFDRQGWWAGLVKIASRISKLYLAHTLFLIACVAR